MAQVSPETKMIHDDSARLDTLEHNVDGIRQRLDTFGHELALIVGQLGPLGDVLQQIQQRINQPTNTMGQVSAFIAGLALLGAIGWTSLQPVKDQGIDTRESLQFAANIMAGLATNIATIDERSRKTESQQQHIEDRVDNTRDIAVANQAILESIVIQMQQMSDARDNE